MKFIIGWIALLSTVAAASNGGVVLQFRNLSDDYLSMHWIDSRTGETALLKSNIVPRSEFSINSHMMHRFEVWQELDPSTGLCGSGDEEACDKIGHFQVTEPDQQEFDIKEGVEILATSASKNSQTTKVRNLIQHIDLNKVENPMDTLTACKERATGRFHELEENDNYDQNDYDSITKEIHDDLHDCMTVGLAPRIKASYDEIEFERTLRMEASFIAENFTCVNTDLESSPDVITEEWTSEKDGVMRVVHKKLERPASRIHVVEHFASPEECKAMEEAAQQDLHVASTADGKGGSRVSAARKAMQAGIQPKFTPEGEPLDGSLISILSKRVYEYTNHVLDMDLSHHGQEPLMSIQYFGRGRHDIEPDRYTPHCDGRCNGEDHLVGGRMATMVIYCTLPKQGGFTNFQNANVHVRPNSGSAVFFSYFNPLTNVTDNGLTQHSGCPVYDGEKKIITQWVRYGVSQATPHGAFNTLGVLKAEDGE